MKTLSILTLLFCSLSLSAQLELVGTFDRVVRMIHLADDEPAIWISSLSDESMELYNLDLTLIASIDIPIEYDGFAQYHVFHVSRTLFDCDPSNIEYMVSYQSPDMSLAYVKVIREDGAILFDLPEHTFHNNTTVMGPPGWGPSMAQDENGVVFVFTNVNNVPTEDSPVTLYRSCGSIPCPCYGVSSEGQGTGLTEFDEHRSNYNLYPNPGNNQFKLEYDLPEGYQRGELQLVDLSGRVVLQRPVGPSMSYIIVNTEGIAGGRYQVVLTTEEGVQLSTSYIELD